MAMVCGHWLKVSPDMRRWLVEGGVCPPCGITLNSPTPWVIPYRQCSCCGTRWVIEDGEVREVIFT